MTTTTLLDYIQKSKVTAFEAGGITQGIGAYKVSVPIDGKSQQCVFLSTPGHEAFGAMRARGARVIDIVIIVVAADDGIHPQTNEAIAHAKATSVPIMIVVNKIDKDGANPECVMQELASIGLMLENWGGDVLVVQISALKWENMDELLETIMLVAELQDLKANPYRSAKGTIIEVRAIFDDQGNHVDEAGPSIPVQNFDDVLVPEDHVSRSYNDTYYVDSQTVLRCHISAHQAELLRKGHTHFLVTGDVYRRDSIDSTHYPIFHQMERFWVFTPDDWEPSGMDGTSYVAEDLKKCLEGLARHLFGTV